MRVMLKDYSNKNLQRASFKNEDLSYASFHDSDLRGADFSGSNLIGADFTHVKTGITPVHTVMIFFAAFIVSLLSGYVAMLAGNTVQTMVRSEDPNVNLAGYTSLVIVIAFIAFSYWKGVGKALKNLILPVCLLAVIIGIIAYVSGAGTGMGVVYLILSLLLVGAMFIVGTAARAAAGTLSNILFIVVALAGGMFGKSLGGGIGSVLMAISCALISKRAMAGAKGFRGLRKVVCMITRKFGTSFRNSMLMDADFSRSELRNSDFTNADVTFVNWSNSKKINCINK